MTAPLAEPAFRAAPPRWRLLVLALPLWACASAPPPPATDAGATPTSAEAGAEPTATPDEPAVTPADSAVAEPAPVAPPAAEPAPPPEPIVVPDPRVAPLAEAAALGDDAARAELAALAGAGAGEAGDQAALALGSLLVAERRWGEALPLLRRAAAGRVAPDVAALLFARAVVEGGVAAAVDEARTLVAPVAATAGTPATAGEARLRAFQLETLAGAWPEAARQGLALLADPPPAAVEAFRLDEARWLTAEALRLAGRGAEALDLYRTIWSETPGSARAAEARERLRAEGVEPEPPAGADRLAWIDTLQDAGLHEEALAELAPLRSAAGDPGLVRQAHRAAAESHFVLRRNDEVVAAAETLRREHPGSPEAAEAALQAMRALGRGDRVADLRAWEAWLRATHPEHPATAEARYYLAAILGGTGGEEAAGLALLGEVAAAGGERSEDALWRIAWIERRRGNDPAAREALEALLAGADAGGGYRTAALYWLARLSGPAGGERAVALYETVRREAPRDYYARAAEERLRELGVEPQPPAAGGGLDVGAAASATPSAPAPSAPADTAPRAADGASTTAGGASAALSPPERLSASPPSLPLPDPLTDPGRRPEPAYRRAVALAALGLPRLAAAELATVDGEGDPALALGRARLLHRGGDTWSSIGLLLDRFSDQLSPLPLDAPGVPREVWETLYPFPHRDAVAEAVAAAAPPGLPFDPWLVATLARRESRFWRWAASPAGAVGVMQLLPDTAARVAAGLGRDAPGRTSLLDPDVNIALGTAELARLVAAFDGEWAPALAAYNAGEAVARQWWVARPPGQPLDEWIETIPYTETRLYVKWILGTRPVYRALYPDAGGG